MPEFIWTVCVCIHLFVLIVSFFDSRTKDYLTIIVLTIYTGHCAERRMLLPV